MAARYATLLAVLCIGLVAPPVHAQESARTLTLESLAQPVDPDQEAESPRSIRDRMLALTAAPQSWQLLSQRVRSWDAVADEWVDESRLTYTRNADGYSTELLVEEWDVPSGAWIPGYRSLTPRDSENRIAESLTETWNPDLNGGLGGWEPAIRYSYTYNAQGQTLVSTTEYWDGAEYFIWSRSTNTYDASGTRRETTTFESATFGPLAPRLRYTFEYDGAGRTTRRLHESYDDGSGTFVNAGNRLWSYDSNGQETEDLEQDWDQLAGDWVNSYRVTTAYAPGSSAPSSIVETEQRWMGGDWENVERNVVDITGSFLDPSEVTSTDQDWDPAANGGLGDWVNVDRSISTVENLAPVAQLYQEWDGAAWVDVDRETTDYDPNGNVVSSLGEVWDGSVWVNSTLIEMTYGEYSSTATEGEVVTDGFRLEPAYPNPFTKRTTVRFSVPSAERVTLAVFDLLGRRVRTVLDGTVAAGEHSLSIDAGSLVPGLYVVRLQQGERSPVSQSVMLVR